MPDRLQVRFNQGAVTSRDRADLVEGECQQLTGFYYNGADTGRAWKIRGRTAFASSTGSAVKGLVLCQFDSGGTDNLVAFVDTRLVSATPGATGTFSNLATGLTASANRLVGAHAHDRWYLTNGVDALRVVENDGTTRLAGMRAPVVRPIATPSAGSGTTRPTVAVTTGTWVGIANAYDTGGLLTSTFAAATLSAAGAATALFKTYGAGVTGTLNFRYRIAGIQNQTSDALDNIGTGGASDSGFKVNLLVEWSENLGATYSTLFSRTNVITAMGNDESHQVAMSVDSANVWVRVTWTYVSGASPATVRLIDMPISTGIAANFSTTYGVYYAWGELDAVRGLYSPAGPESVLTALVGQNQMSVKTPINGAVGSTAQNANSTHWVLYRNFDSAASTIPQGFGIVAKATIASTAVVDNFILFDKDTQPSPLLAMKSYTVGTGTIRVPRDSPPPVLDFITAYGGGLVGIKGRSAFYSEPGRFVESWPETNVVATFDLPEHDALVSAVPIGTTLVFLCSEAVVVASDLPREISGTYNAARAEPLPKAPGCVGPYAATAYSADGEPRCAWVSRYGIFSTNGQVTDCLSGDMDWEGDLSVANLGTAVLTWDAQRHLLVFAYDGTGAGSNNRYALFHMDSDHLKQNGSPKVTFPHYGSIACLAAAPVAGLYKVYTGHPTDGNVYLEWTGGVDASRSYSGTILPGIAQSGRMYDKSRFVYALRGLLYHTDFGTAQTAAVSWTAGEDQAGTEQAVNLVIPVAGHKGQDLHIGRLGEWHEVTVTHLGEASDGAALGTFSVQVRAAGEKGRIAG